MGIILAKKREKKMKVDKFTHPLGVMQATLRPPAL